MKLFQDGIFKDGAVETENRKRRKSYQRSEDAQTVSLQVCLFTFDLIYSRPCIFHWCSSNVPEHDLERFCS